MEQLIDAAEAVLPDVVDLRRRIHAEPELGLELPKTQQAVLDALEGLGLDVRTGSSTTSVVADLSGPSDVGSSGGPTILLRADMDALPMPEDTGLDFASTIDGTMHACGHDAHVAMLAGAARVLAARRAELAGNVRFMFQPGEEGFGGARYMIDEGLLEAPTVDAVFALHVAPNLPSGAIWTRGGVVDGVGRRDRHRRQRQGWPRVDTVPDPGPDSGRGRDHPGPPDVRDAPHRHVRPGRHHASRMCAPARRRT